MNRAAVSEPISRPTPCACGSGLSHGRCCGLTAETVARLPQSPEAEGLVARALAAHRQGATDMAAQLCVAVLEAMPTHLQALRILGEIRKERGPASAAEALLRRLTGLDPNDFWATTELALMLLQSGRLADAEPLARNAVRLAPENPQAHNLLGMILTEAQRPRMGEFHYRRVLDLTHARDPILLANLAWNLKNQGRMEEARDLYRESVALAPNVAQTLLGWAQMEEADRRFEQAAEILDRAEREFPADRRFLLARATLLGRMRRCDEGLLILDAIARADPAGGLGPAELFQQGTLLDRAGRYDAAFAAFAESKRKARENGGATYLAAEAQSLADRLRRFFVAGRLRTLPRAPRLPSPPRPVFILGFPRSGTTLLEQMLSAHSSITAGDELPAINDIAAALPRSLDSVLPYPDALAELWMADHHQDLEDLRDGYMRRVARWGVNPRATPLFTDKMPLNETHLGLISLLFPDAPFIHVLRHPLDVVLSVFFNHLTHGFFCAAELESAARHYALVFDLVEHYRQEIELRYLPVRYEELVARPEANLRAAFAFLGESFDPACLRFEDNPRFARTASYAQVSEPLYDRSCHRHRNYLRHLAPVIPILQPAIERLGYRIG